MLTAARDVNVGAPSLWAWLSGSADEALTQLRQNNDIVDHVSLGGFSVGHDLSLSGPGPNRTILMELKQLGIAVHPLIGGSDIKTLRALFSNESASSAFIEDSIKRAAASGYAGYNIDFEPYNEETTFSDALAFASFADKMAKGLHKSGNIKLSIDYFSNLPFWNIGALNSTTEVDYLISMDTYVPGNESFRIYENIAQTHIDSRRLGIGMCTGIRGVPYTPFGPDPCGLSPWTDNQIDERLAHIFDNANDMPAMLNLWVLPLPEIWWSGLRKWYTMREY